jgi:membrane associated rhomboid family serine protease
MIMLWLAGTIFSQFMPAKRIYWVYILGGLVGNILYILSFNYFPVFEAIAAYSFALGASGGILAVLTAAATKVPNFPVRLLFIGEVRLKWLAIVLIILDILNIPNGNSGGHFAHLGGALFGFLFVFIPILSPKIQIPKLKKSPKFRPNPSFRPKTDEQYNAERTEYRKRVDKILDKVAQSGYGSLSKEEKDFLFNTSTKKNW